MPEVSSHAPGSFSWVELATTDQQGGVTFYRSLLGWNVNEIPLGPGETYSMLTLRGLDVAAAHRLSDDERRMGIPSHWNMYVSVTDADATAKRARELGATVLAAPFDVMDVGRMAVLQDPTGAVFCVWQAKRHVGARVVAEPGALCWSELTTRDPKAAEAFYTALFGWRPEHSAPGAAMEYTEFSVGDTPSIGMMAMPPAMPAGVRSHWMPYFQVEDCATSTDEAKALGASVLVGPQEIANTGRFTVLQDPQRAAFAIFAPK